MNNYLTFFISLAILYCQCSAFQGTIHRTTTKLRATSGTTTDIQTIRSSLVEASKVKSSESDAIVANLISLEKLMREQNRKDEGKTSDETYKNLNGAWRLIFTTGTVETQKKMGRINYFPLKAVQTFDTTSNDISNAIFIGDFALIKFFGKFEWRRNLRKVEFDFDEIAIFGFRFGLPSGGAAKIGQSTGLGSESNLELLKQSKKPFFNWVLADDDIAVARGGGGGLALWRRVAVEQ